VKISLFSQSLFALPLDEAIEETAATGFTAIELACIQPHFDLAIARRDPERVAERIQRAGLAVSALSLFTRFTDPNDLQEQLENAEAFMALAPVFNTRLVKLTPGPPASVDAADHHWRALQEAIDRLVPVAREFGIRLAFETHMRQLTDSLASSRRLLEMAPRNVVGLTVDFSNLSFAGETMSEVVAVLNDRMYHTHLKNGYVDQEGGWHFQALDRGLTDYPALLQMLHDVGYGGYLSIECLGPDAQERPIETAQRDLNILKRFLEQIG